MLGCRWRKKRIQARERTFLVGKKIRACENSHKMWGEMGQSLWRKVLAMGLVWLVIVIQSYFQCTRYETNTHTISQLKRHTSNNPTFVFYILLLKTQGTDSISIRSSVFCGISFVCCTQPPHHGALALHELLLTTSRCKTPEKLRQIMPRMFPHRIRR